MTGTWDPILPSSLPSFVPCRFTLPLPPLSTPCYYLHPWPLLPTRLAQPLARLDTSLVSPLSFSFPSCRDPPPRIYPIYDHLFSASLFPSRCLPMRTSPPCTLLSKYYFSSATNAKLKRISPYSLCKYAGIATRVASFSFVSPPPPPAVLSLSLSHRRLLSPSSSRSYVYGIRRMDTETSCGCNWDDGLFYFSARDC